MQDGGDTEIHQHGSAMQGFMRGVESLPGRDAELAQDEADGDGFEADAADAGQRAEARTCAPGPGPVRGPAPTPAVSEPHVPHGPATSTATSTAEPTVPTTDSEEQAGAHRVSQAPSPDAAAHAQSPALIPAATPGPVSHSMPDSMPDAMPDPTLGAPKADEPGSPVPQLSADAGVAVPATTTTGAPAQPPTRSRETAPEILPPGKS